MNSVVNISKRLGTGHGHKQAFTIVELIVTIVVIGILVALTIVSYGSWRERVAMTEVNSDLLNVQAAMEDARNRASSPGEGYPTFAPNTPFDDSVPGTKRLFTQSKNVTVTYVSGNATDYCVIAVSKEKPAITMYVDISFSLKPITGPPWAGTC